MGTKWEWAKRLISPLAYIVVVGAIGAGVWFGRQYWRPLLTNEPEPAHADHDETPIVDKPSVLELSAQARANLELVVAPAKVQTYWRTIQIPGVIEDRPGLTDRGLTAPLAGVITRVHAFEGDIVQPGEKLFTLRLVSEYLQQAQSDLFKAIREVEILNKEINRIQALVDSGTIPGKRKIELEQQVSRQNARIDAYRQDLISRGLSPQQVERVEQGDFLTSIEIVAPDVIEKTTETNNQTESLSINVTTSTRQDFFEIQDFKVELGQQVQSGQALVVLANHYSLYIKGHAFKKEASSLARAAERSWNVEVDFPDDVADDWTNIDQTFQIRHLSNTTDPDSRTFDFFIPLENQSRVYEKQGRPFVLWRFRPGQRVNIRVPVDEIDNVLVLPTDAVVFEGPEAFVFQQNGDLFNRIPVEIVHQDRTNVVLANDGSISPGFYLAQNASASLNRVLKSQAASGAQPGFHVHADGTVHASH
ncbi:MAG: MchE protein [Planctomycetota bacterium]